MLTTQYGSKSHCCVVGIIKIEKTYNTKPKTVFLFRKSFVYSPGAISNVKVSSLALAKTLPKAVISVFSKLILKSFIFEDNRGEKPAKKKKKTPVAQLK